MTDPTTQLQQLQSLRGVLGDDLYNEGLARLRTQYGDAAVDSALESMLQSSAAPPEQTITNTAPNQGAQGVFYGNVYLYGQRGKQASELIGAYLERQVRRCGSLPLQGVYQQKASDDVLAISLEQVYTQLATTKSVTREQITGAELHHFNAQAFLDQHIGEHVMPSQQRDKTGFLRYEDMTRYAYPGEPVEITRFSATELEQFAKESTMLEFFGPQLVTEAITQHQHLVLLGEPGSGKSTALRYLALTLAQAGLDETVDLAAQLEGWDTLGEQGRLLPLFLPLLPFAKRFVNTADRHCNADDLWNYIATELEANGRYEGLAAAVHEELENGRVLLMLDGLDEVAGSESRRQVVRAVQAFADHYPACRIVVTCRVRAYEGQHNQQWQLPGWQTATLADWTLGQMQHFVQAWYAAAAASGGMSAEKRNERVTALQGAIERRDDLKRLGIRPLLLTIMALVHYNDGQLPEERVGLYSRCVDLLLGQWELAKADGSGYGRLTDYIGLPDTDVKALRPLLQQAAFAAHEASSTDNPGSLGRLTLREMVMEALAQKGHPNPFAGAERFLEYTDVRSGLLQASDAGDSYSFPHLTFQEYLAGLELVNDVAFVERILARRNDDRWRVPIALGVSHTVSEGVPALFAQLLDELLYQEGRTPEQEQRDLLLAAELAEDAGWYRLERGGAAFKRLRRDLAAALVPVVEGTTLPAKDRVQAGMYLGWLGDPRPGVCTLPPAMVRIEGGTFVIGITSEAAAAAGQAYAQYHRDRGDTETAERARNWSQDEINDQPLTLPTFELARYPLTNAQWQCFIDVGGYDPDAPWWDEAGRAWLQRDDQATEGLDTYQRRDFKQHPEWWQHSRYGKTRPNHPVVGISWYEAVAFCRWLTQHPEYNLEGYHYLLPSEAEWEYAARRATRRSYPWSDDEPDAECANYDQIHGGTTAVGCFPMGVTPDDGLHDLAGNVLEWTRSEYRDYPYDPNDGRETPDSPAEKAFTLRGGGWVNRSVDLRTCARFDFPSDHLNNSGGCRLARYLPLEKS
jgi:formylglycine-generating enzyme required for sulfatase activity